MAGRQGVSGAAFRRPRRAELPSARSGPAVDDDGNSVIDDLSEFIAGTGGTVVGDDKDLDLDGDFWGLVATEPDPDQTRDGDGVTVEWNKFGWIDNEFSGQVGSQSNRAETTVQDSNRLLDWGSPGKQHGPDLATPNADGEINRYDD